ncbi:hypothetical protein JW859_05345 [bacterium]|nr:hypothetical protein [bacterium]
MAVRIVSVALVFVLLSFGLALAHCYEDLTVDEIRALPDFVADDYSLSSATNSGDEDALFVYHWIGYIPHGDKRVYFTSFGEPLTCVQWEATGEWVPEWVVEALNRLLSEGYIKLD